MDIGLRRTFATCRFTEVQQETRTAEIRLEDGENSN